MTIARSTPNIALIKYWGNRDDRLRLPAADSLSMTLDGPHVDVEIMTSDRFAVRSFEPDGTEKPLNEGHIARFCNHHNLMREYLATLSITAADLPADITITVRSHIPPAIGLASSAAVFSAVAKAYAKLIRDIIVLDEKQISILARLGSGSAARSIFGGFVALVNESTSNEQRANNMSSAYAEPIAPAEHWPLHDVIIIPSRGEKRVGSTEGHASAHTSPHFAARIANIPHRQRDCIAAIHFRDFEKLRHVAEEDALDMHRCMQSQHPPLQYLSAETYRIIEEIDALRRTEHLPVLYTMDAGPTVHLVCEESALERVWAYAQEQKEKGCAVYGAQCSGKK